MPVARHSSSGSNCCSALDRKADAGEEAVDKYKPKAYNTLRVTCMVHVFSPEVSLQRIKASAPRQAIQTPKLENIAALLPTAPVASHGSSLVIHSSKKWVKSLVAALEQLPASSGHEACGLCRSDARCASSYS